MTFEDLIFTAYMMEMVTFVEMSDCMWFFGQRELGFSDERPPKLNGKYKQPALQNMSLI